MIHTQRSIGLHRDFSSTIMAAIEEKENDTLLVSKIKHFSTNYTHSKWTTGPKRRRIPSGSGKQLHSTS